jgi:CheY-like chemotaxis protein
MNFGSNAVKYNRPGGSVSFAASRVADDRVRISIVDTGLGIPRAEHAKLFQPFHRAGQETGPIEGTGIGLAISKRLAELMSAEVGFRSEVGVGSTFWVDVPANTSPLGIPSIPNVSVPSTLVARTARSVLYIEDNPANVAFMTDLLGAFEGIDLVTATTAELGLALVGARRPEAIIMDIHLPGMSGLQALSALRASPTTASIPVIALTAAASEKERTRGLEAGFFRYLTKPVQVDELLGALEAILATEG